MYIYGVGLYVEVLKFILIFRVTIKCYLQLLIRADVYAFGVTVYELLTGVKPFEGQTQKAMLANQLNQRYRIRELRVFNSNIPIKLDELIIKCLDFIPEKRPPNMTILVREIHRIMGVR